MAKYIEFGFRNKKLLLPFGVVLLQIITNALDMVIAEPAKESNIRYDSNRSFRNFNDFNSLFEYFFIKTSN